MEGYLMVLIITFSVKVRLVCSLICKCALNHPLYTLTATSVRQIICLSDLFRIHFFILNHRASFFKYVIF